MLVDWTGGAKGVEEGLLFVSGVMREMASSEEGVPRWGVRNA